MADSQLVQPYAAAVFDLASAAERREQWSSTLALLATIAADERVVHALGLPQHSRAERAELICSIGGDHLDTAATNLVRLLAENDRLALLPALAERFEALRARAEARIDVEVTAAAELDTDQSQRLEQALAKRFQRDVRLASRVDPALIGGAVIRAGDRVVDGSLQGRLARLAGQLAH